MSQLRSLVERFYEQFNTQDLSNATEVLDPNAETTAPGGGTIRGVEPFLAYTRGFIRAFPDGRINLRQAVESGETIMVEGSYTGTNTGPIMNPQGEVPPTGRKLDLPFCDVFQVRDGRIVSHHVYFDQVDFMTQMGLMPAPAKA